MSGNTIRQNVCQRVAPRHAAASSKTTGRSFSATTIGVSISGNVPDRHRQDEAPDRRGQVVGEVVDEDERDPDDRARHVQRQGQRREQEPLAGNG